MGGGKKPKTIIEKKKEKIGDPYNR